MRSSVIRATRAILELTPLRRYLHYRYQYNFTPARLAFLIACLDRTREVEGCIIEVGCAGGATACFLNRHMRDVGIEKDYYCVDTFAGFLPEDVAYERRERKKESEDFTGFQVNSLKSVKYTLALNGCERVVPISADAKEYKPPGAVSFALVDVDLYRPTLAALRNLWPSVSAGGMVVVDDCWPNQMFDGALQACNEFCAESGTTLRFMLDTLAVISK